MMPFNDSQDRLEFAKMSVFRTREKIAAGAVLKCSVLVPKANWHVICQNIEAIGVTD